MRNADIQWKVRSLIELLDDWLERIDNETDPAEDYKTDGMFKDVSDEMSYPYQAGVWKARAGMNADKLRRTKAWLLNEFESIGVQSRLK